MFCLRVALLKILKSHLLWACGGREAGRACQLQLLIDRREKCAEKAEENELQFFF